MPEISAPSPRPALAPLLLLLALLAGPGPVAAQPAEEPGAWDHLKRFPVDLASDAWATIAAPVRVRGADAWGLAGVLGATGILFALDRSIQDEVRRSRDGDLARGLVDVAEFVEPVALMGKTNGIYAGGFVLGSLTGWDPLRLASEELLISHWIAGALRKGLGRPIGRRRPDETPDDPYVFDFMEGSSLPSGHASTITQVAAVLSHHIDRWPATVALYAVAGSVVYQRVAADKHWASDSFLGAAWGWGVAKVVIRRREAGRTDFVPLFDPGTGALGLRVPVGF